MKRLAVAFVATALMASPALAQQSGNGLGNLLENLGRSFNGDNSQTYRGGNSQSEYQQTYNDSQRQFRNESDQQLQRDDQKLRDAWNRLRAASQALDDEMSRRGIRTGSNENGYRGGNYSGSSNSRGNEYDGGRRDDQNDSYQRR